VSRARECASLTSWGHNESMILPAILVVLFLALAGLLLWLPERHFRSGSRKLRIVGAVAFLIAAAATLVSIIAG
jgi:hypothetical protein